jgi:hypothetical protein
MPLPGQRTTSTADTLTDVDLTDIGPDGVQLAAGPTHQFLRVNDDRTGGILPSHGPRFALECHYRIRGPLDVRALSAAVDRLVAHQPALRTAVHLTGEPGELHQTVHPAPQGVLRHHAAESPGSRSPAEFLAALDLADPLDAAAGHVFTATLLTATDPRRLPCQPRRAVRDAHGQRGGRGQEGARAIPILGV